MGVLANVGTHVDALGARVSVHEVVQDKLAVVGGHVLAEALVAVAHEVVDGDQGLKRDHPAGALRALDQKVRHLRNGYVYLRCALEKI